MAFGVITGEGRYVSSAGVIREGHFENGQLHGPGILIEPNGFRQEGTFLQGELHGIGKIISKNGDEYAGSFEHGVKHGRGVSKYATGEVHRGFWNDGDRTGYGTFAFGNAKRVAQVGTAWASNAVESDFLYEGAFVDGDPCVRHANYANNEKAKRCHVPFTTRYATEKLRPIREISCRELKSEKRHVRYVFSPSIILKMFC